LEVAIIKHLKISEVFHVTGNGLCENPFSLKAVAGLEMSDYRSPEYESGT
jgi:hypothetical protein